MCNLLKIFSVLFILVFCLVIVSCSDNIEELPDEPFNSGEESSGKDDNNGNEEINNNDNPDANKNDADNSENSDDEDSDGTGTDNNSDNVDNTDNTNSADNSNNDLNNGDDSNNSSGGNADGNGDSLTEDDQENSDDIKNDDDNNSSNEEDTSNTEQDNLQNDEDNINDEIATIPTYTVVFDFCCDIQNSTAETKDKLTAPSSPKRDGYEFLGWYYGNAVWDFNANVVSDMTLCAKWEIKEYKVTYVLYGGKNNENNPAYYTIEAPLSALGAPTLENGYFMGWYTDADFTEKFVSCESFCDITLYANFLTESTGLVFEERSDEYYITDYQAADSVVVIPRTHNGKSVTGIASGAFLNVQEAEIILPNSIKCIEKDAFDIFSSVKFNVVDGIYYLGNKENPYYALIGVDRDSEPEECIIHSETLLITDYAFAEFSLLTEIHGGENLLYIGDSAFSRCSMLSSFPEFSNLIEIGDSAFIGCRSLDNIKLPETLTAIGNSLFSYCTNLKCVILPDSISEISENAFKNCEDLEYIVLGNGLKKISNGAFDQVNGDLKVFFHGDKILWENIDFANNYILRTNNVFFYSENAPNTDGSFWHYANKEPCIWT